MLPTVEQFCGNNTTRFDMGTLVIWFSYQTPVAFMVNGVKRVSENCWSTTTGKHLNAIDGGDKKSRMPRAAFEALLREATQNTGFSEAA